MLQSSLILFRASGSEDAFEAVFEKQDWSVHSIPVLSFTYLSRDQLKSYLTASYGGMIVTSPRAGDLLGALLKEDSLLLDIWRQKPCVCIGQRTAASLIECGLSPVIAGQAESKGVAARVISLEAEKYWLFVCGNLRRNELPAQLMQAGVLFEELQVYKTHPISNIYLHNMEQPDWVAFFSPSGVQAVMPRWPDHWDDVKKAAIGKTTARAITAVGWKVDAIAEKPEPEALLDAVAMRQSF